LLSSVSTDFSFLQRPFALGVRDTLFQSMLKPLKEWFALFGRHDSSSSSTAILSNSLGWFKCDRPAFKSIELIKKLLASNQSIVHHILHGNHPFKNSEPVNAHHCHLDD
jgi:hypothetical protein